MPIPLDEVEQRAAVGEPHARAASGRRDQRGHRERTPAQPCDVAQRAFVGLGREFAPRRPPREPPRSAPAPPRARRARRAATAADFASSAPPSPESVSARPGNAGLRSSSASRKTTRSVSAVRDPSDIPSGVEPRCPRYLPICADTKGLGSEGGTRWRWRYATRRCRGAGAAAHAKPLPRNESPHLALLRAPRRPAPAIPLAGEIRVATYNVHRWTGLERAQPPGPRARGLRDLRARRRPDLAPGGAAARPRRRSARGARRGARPARGVRRDAHAQARPDRQRDPVALADRGRHDARSLLQHAREARRDRGPDRRPTTPSSTSSPRTSRSPTARATAR